MLLIYTVGLFIYRKSNKSEDRSVSSVSTPSIIATPRNYIINVIENRDEIDIQQYADVSINIKDILEKTHPPQEEENGITSKSQISYEEIDFLEYITIKIKKNEN